MVGIVQRSNTPGCGPGKRGFKSLYPPQSNPSASNPALSSAIIPNYVKIRISSPNNLRIDVSLTDSKTEWHAISTEKALETQKSHADGLNSAEVEKRQVEFGFNQLKAKKAKSIILVFFQQFLNPLIYVLIAAAVISLVSQFFTDEQHYVDVIVIVAVILLNAAIGTFQETQAEKAMTALLEMAAPKAKIKRNGKLEVIPAREIVPGDIVFFESGDKVPADIRILEASNLKLNESALTGESMPVEKQAIPVAANTDLAERTNMLYMSTIITNGRASGLVIGTGMSTEIGRIASGIEESKDEQTPLQKNINQLTKYLLFVFLCVCAILIVVGLIQGLGIFEVALLAIAAAVASIPEGLPAVVTVVLAIGMRTMARRNAIVRRLVAVETLGSATVICSDKTGTLTLNQMTVRRLAFNHLSVHVSGEGYDPKGDFILDGKKLDIKQNAHLELLLKIGALCNDSTLTSTANKVGIVGDPTEGALVVAAAKAGFTKESLQTSYPRLDEISFESENQYMATLHRVDGENVVYIKGSTEKILAFSKFYYKDGQALPMTAEKHKQISDSAASMAAEGLRVIALAYIKLPQQPAKLTHKDIQDNLVYAGLSAMADPPREDAKEAIKRCHGAGIKVIMITGDNKITAESIAHQLNLGSGKTVTGPELKQMNDQQLSDEIEHISVFARIEPLHKLRIVNALKKRGHIVAMTGDGVNDAPALKAANIGISMGITGTDVAKEASDMVLADDNFSTIVSAIDEGRAIFTRLRNVLFYTLNTNISELFTLILAIIFVGQSPLLAVQILWVNLVTDTAGDIPLGMEPKFGDELNKPPRHPSVGLMYPGLMIRILVMAVIIGIGTFLIFRWAAPRMSVEEARSLAFTAMVAFEWFMAFSARSDEHTIFKIGIWRNKALVISIGLAILLQIAVIYVPFLQTAFHTYPLSLRDWAIVIGAAGGVFILEELRKLFFPHLFGLGKYMPKNKIAVK
jgi:P-type Ca2+ transporter type 2C